MLLDHFVPNNQLARENPEPIFDISECDISQVPSGIYSLCRVFLKETLNMSHNLLSSLSGGGNLKDLQLIKVLDLRNNSFTSLPDDIHLLKNLSEFYLSHNQLKKLPPTLCNLEKLNILDVQNNSLKILPEQIGQLLKLRELHLSGNKIKQMPKSISKCQRLKVVSADSNYFEYPPSTIIQEGAEEIIKYICKDIGCVYNPSLEEPDAHSSTEAKSYSPDDDFQAKMWQLEKLKEQKAKEFLEIEKHNELLQRQELELANSLKTNRKKLLEDITQQQNKLDSELAKIQHVKDIERFRLIEQLQEVEQNADRAIMQLLTLNNEPLAQLLEQEKLEEARLIAAANKYNESYRKENVLLAMQDLLDQELRIFNEYNEDRDSVAKSALELETVHDSKISEVLRNKDIEQAELICQLQEDSNLQKWAVTALLERVDARSWGLIQQVKLVEIQLAALTSIEMDRKKLEVDEQVNDLAEKRLNLSMLLMDLLEQQNIRRSELLSTIQCLEDCNNTEDFWLRQYQRLLDRLPPGLSEAQKNMNPALAEALLMSGVIHCLPFLAKWSQNENDLLYLNEDDLKEVGISQSEDRRGILEAIRIFKKTKEDYSAMELPTAPQVDEAASAPSEIINSFVSSECVVCLDQVCQVIFVPCGHYCTCVNCSKTLVECPLCRQNIERKLRSVQ